MKKVVLYNPAISSINIGDEIIADGVKSALRPYLDDSFVIEMSTHTPISMRYQYYLGKADTKFVCGSNLLMGKVNAKLHLKQWFLEKVTLNMVGPCVFVGVGSQQYNQKMNRFTRETYKKTLSSEHIHSVRDSYTENALREIGVTNVINTGCPTMWGLKPEHCKKIPTTKAESVVFTLTDYKPNTERDEYLIKVLKENYKKTYFWIQGYGDYEYFVSLKGHEDISLIAPRLTDYDAVLDNESIDFVGTRLHGGIRAMQKGHRTIILGVDNRAIELNKDFNIPVLIDKDIKQLGDLINSEFVTDIKLPVENIKKFLAQFDIECK